MTGLPDPVPESTGWFSQMAIIPIPDIERSDLYQRLLQDYSIEIPITGWGNQRYFRASMQGYNSPEDLDRLYDAAADLL